MCVFFGVRVCVFLCLCPCVCVLVQIGQFFGEVDPVLMINLVNTSLYSFNKTYDYQSVCDPERDSKAAAGPRSVYVVRHTRTHVHRHTHVCSYVRTHTHTCTPVHISQHSAVRDMLR